MCSGILPYTNDKIVIVIVKHNEPNIQINPTTLWSLATYFNSFYLSY